MDYLVLWGGAQKGREKLYQTGDEAAHARIVARLKARETVRWNVIEPEKVAGEEEKEC